MKHRLGTGATATAVVLFYLFVVLLNVLFWGGCVVGLVLLLRALDVIA